MSIEKRYKAAHEKFFADNPNVVAEIESVSANVIEACGMTVDEYRLQRRYAVFAEAAAARGLEVGEFVIRLVAESPEQADSWRLENHRALAAALGMEWDEYKELNGIN